MAIEMTTTRRFLIFFVAFVAGKGSLCCQGNPDQPGIKVLHYDFMLSIPESGRLIEGQATITVTRSVAVDRLVLDLIGLQVDSVWVNARSADFLRGPATLRISLGSPVQTAPDTLLVGVRYHGEVKDGLIMQADEKGRWYAFGDNWPNRARYWLPTVDRPDYKATVTWNVTAPSDSRVIANGELMGERRLPSEQSRGLKPRTLTQWKTSRPIPPYLMVVAVGPMASSDLGLTAPGLSEFPPGVRQTVYVVPELADYIPGPFEKAGAIVEFFAKMVAPFPYEKLAHLQSFTRYGGMENASAIFYADNVFRSRGVTAGLIAHETAHQWFGDAVTPMSWGHLWLSEGFATYFERLWMEKSSGVAAFRSSMKDARDEIIRSRVIYERPVIDTLQTDLMELLNTNSYEKGAWTLHMLRSLLGDSLFFAGIREYYSHHRHSNATSDDLCAQLEKTTHTSLRWFFDQWLRRPGIPEITLGWTFDRDSLRLTVFVKQGSRFPAYRFPLKIEIFEPDGRNQIVTVEVPAVTSVQLAIPVNLDQPPSKLVFDPQIELLGSLKSSPSD